MTNSFSRKFFRAFELDGLDEVITDALSSEDKRTFEARQRSVALCHAGHPYKTITEQTGRSRQQVIADAKRVLTIDENGKKLGWTALIKNKRHDLPENPDSKRNIRRRKGFIFGRGAFSKLLAANPTIKAGLDNLIGGKNPDGSPRAGTISPREIHDGLLALCREAGLSDTDYPIVTADQGRRALYDYREKILKKHPEIVLRALYGDSVIQELRNAAGRTPSIEYSSRLFEAVEIDGHELPVFGAIQFPSAHPLRPMIAALKHITLVFVVERSLSAILGYSVRYGRSYGASDVLRAIRRAIVPWTPLDLDPRLGLRYLDGAGLPCGVIPGLAFALWRDLHWDNLAAHVSPFLMDQLPACIPISSPRAAPDTHAIVESINAEFDRLFRGTRIDKASPDAAESAMALLVTPQVINQIIDVCVANFNVTPPAGSNVPKLEILRHFANDPRSIIVRVPEPLRKRFVLYDFEAVQRICGSKRKTAGQKITRPFINFAGAKYTSEELARRFDLIGKELVLRGTSEDLRVIRVWLKEDGTPLGELNVIGQWQIARHGFETRKLWDKIRRKYKDRESRNPVATVLMHLMNEAKSSSRAALQLATVIQESGDGLSDLLRLAGRDPYTAATVTTAGHHDGGDLFPDLDTLY